MVTRGKPPMLESKYVVVITACPSEDEANTLARALIDRRLAACVQANPITSTYHWQGKVEQAEEVRLLIKTTSASFGKISEVIQHTLSYETPEILSVPVIDGLPEYLNWIDAETQP